MRERPVANDTFAARFMDDTARTVAQRFSALKRPFASFPVRHRVIDDLLRGVLERDPTGELLERSGATRAAMRDRKEEQ